MPLLRRREFLLASSAAAGAVMFSGCVPPPRQVEGESRVLLAEDLLSAYDNWYATACRGCEAGCGALVRVVDGRARKVEGNPNHPLNQGKLCARGQAMVQEQYHPDRLRGPIRRDPSVRAGGAFESLTWSAALDTLVGRLAQIRGAGRTGEVVLITPSLAAHQAMLVDAFARAYGLQWLSFEPVSEAPLRAAARSVFAFDQLPWFDVAHARTILSFGADFLGSWLSPVRFGIEYGVFRHGSYAAAGFQPRHDATQRGYLIHVDSHFSVTAASADEWVWCRPGAEGTLALSIAHALGASGLDAYAPEQTSDRTAVAPERVGHIANLLRDDGPSLVIAGGLAGAHTHGSDALAAILSLNLLLDNVAKPGGVLPSSAPIGGVPERSAPATVAEWQDLIARMNDGRVQAVLVAGGANPVHGLPTALGFGDALMRIPFVASLASFEDDTSSLADVVLPSSLPLEDWGDATPAAGAVASSLTMQQPVVGALFDTRSFYDVLLTVADELGGPVRDALPWPTFKDLLQDQVGQFNTTHMPSPRFWNQLLQNGGQWASTTMPAPRSPAGGQQMTAVPEPQFSGDAQAYPFWLVPFVHNTLGAGQSAHLPWLQAAPDPVSSVTWQTWVSLHPSVAAWLSVREGDIVSVESPRGRIEAPAYVSPAAPPEVVSIPLGQGHTAGGRWARGRGANPMHLLDPLADATTGALAYAATRVKLTRTGRSISLPKLEGMAPARQLPGQEVVKVIQA